jgi:hypothetical protein
MVRIINYLKRQSEEKDFFVLELQGGIEMVKSQNTGKFYVTAKKAFISSTFDEETCKALIGTEMEGSIVKTTCEPFEYTVKETGEIIVLNHKYVYMPDSEVPSSEDKAIQRLLADENSFSKNGQHKEEFVM